MADTRDAQADPVTLLVEDVARKLPKVELHLHLDGSLCEEFIVPRLAALGLASPLAATETGGAFTSLNEWALQVKRRPELLTDDMIAHKGQSGNEKMNLFNWANQFLQTADDLYEATKGLCDSLRASHNVVYAEVRFCPTLHTLNGLSELQATNAAIEGFKASGMPGGIIICALRTMPEPHWHDMATLAIETAAIGFDVAGYEPGNPIAPMSSAIKRVVASRSCGVTLHVAEWAGDVDGETGRCATLANLEAALALGVDRLGHALQMGGCPELIERVKEAGMHVECNPFGNMRLLAQLSDHPVREFVSRGLSVSLNCDNTLFSGTPEYHHDGGPSRQLAYMHYSLGMDWETLREMTLDSVDAAFCPDVDKEALKERIRLQYATLVSPHA